MATLKMYFKKSQKIKIFSEIFHHLKEHRVVYSCKEQYNEKSHKYLREKKTWHDVVPLLTRFRHGVKTMLLSSLFLNQNIV